MFKLVDIGADDGGALLARLQNHTNNVTRSRERFGTLNNAAEFFNRALAQRVGALTFAVECCPGNFLTVDFKTPIVKPKVI